MSAPRLVLASSSKIRKSILDTAGIDVIVRPSSVDEAEIKADPKLASLSPGELATELAMAKAKSVSRADNEVVLGADQIMVMDSQMYDKSTTIKELRQRLLHMRGKDHVLVGAQVLLASGHKPWVYHSRSVMSVRHFSDDWLDAYLQQEGESVLYCVGGYKYEGLGAQLFERVEGDFTAILGLELLPLMSQLRRLGVLKT